jgi:lipid-binding SYLF domain-containing protein
MEPPEQGDAARNQRTKIGLALGGILIVLFSAPPSNAASGVEIEASVRATLAQFFREIWSSRELANQAVGILVFPTVVKAGFGIGGEYGEGALHIRGRTAGFYNMISGSIGFQFGAQARSVIIMFMTEHALAGFQRTDGWKIGVDGSVAIIAIGAGVQSIRTASAVRLSASSSIRRGSCTTLRSKGLRSLASTGSHVAVGRALDVTLPVA